MEVNKEKWGALAAQSMNMFLEYEKNPNWKLFSDKGETEKFSLEIGERLATMGRRKINCPYKQVIAAVLNPETTHLVDTMNEISKSIYKDADFEILFMKYKGIWPVAGRDLVLLGIQKEIENKYYVVTKTLPDYQYPGDKGIVRAYCYVGGYCIKNLQGQGVEVTYISDVDLKGSIPNMIKKQIAKEQANVPDNLAKHLLKK